RAAFVVFATLAGISAVQAQTPVTEGFRDFSYGSDVTGRPTGEKPESKLWWNDGSWWGSLYVPSAGRYRIHRFDVNEQRWIDTGTSLDEREKSKADVLWDAPSGKLYVASHLYQSEGAPTSASGRARLYRYTYDPGSRTYTLDPGFPVTISLGRGEALTIAKDSNDRLWITYVESTRVKINHSLSSDTQWATPFDLPVDATSITVSSDDISAIIAFGGDRVGVMWSNQVTKKVYFSIHNDDDPVTQWSAPEQVLPNGPCSSNCADDHINLKTDTLGRVFAALKTSATSSSQPLIMLAVRGAGGGWDAYTVSRQSEKHTRPIVLLDESNDRVYVVDTNEGGGSAFIKSSSMSSISFPTGHGQVFIRSALDPHIDDVTSTKQNLNEQTGLLVIACDSGTQFYLHNFLSFGGPSGFPPDPPENLEAEAVSHEQIDLSWDDASDNEDTFHIERKTTGAFEEIASVPAGTTSFSDTGLNSSTTYTYRVRARNLFGTSAPSNEDEATTLSPGPRIKNITFEDGALVNATTGVDSVTGPVTLDGSGALKGTHSALLANVGPIYLEENFEAVGEIYLSLYVQLHALPPETTRIVVLVNGSTALANIQVTTAGRLRLRLGTTTIGALSPPLTIGETYRIGIHQKAGSGSNGVIEAFLSSGDDPFGGPFASTTTSSVTAATNRLRIGPTGSNDVNLGVDDIRLDAAAMPDPSDD
ncbi:MAG TPA: fibronectin type III domain-containing protein, partial [Vicinamibacterales bacterium]|nr:fibronectin type III domain-containing protein [Vicinamibacterales bacterium]